MDKIKLTIEGYNKIAKHWDGTRRHGWDEVYQYIDSNILKILKKENKFSNFKKIFNFIFFKNRGKESKNNHEKPINLLDLGCGNGRLIDFLKEKEYFKFINYIGIDPSSALIDICDSRYKSRAKITDKNIKDLYQNINFELNDGLNISLPDNDVDIAISLAVLHHIPTEYQDIWLSELYRVIRKNKNSRVILSVWIQKKIDYQGRNSGKIKDYKKENDIETLEENTATLEKTNTRNKTIHKTIHKKISNNELLMGFAQYQDIRYVYLFTEVELKELFKKNKLNVLETYTNKRPNSDHINLTFILAPNY